MTTLSDRDIRRELGKNILMYPFNESNLKGASYNLTASKLAWNLSDKKSIYHIDKGKIIIPSKTTALIETHETMWVSQKISGTYHSRVTQVSQGTGHIGTTLDPNYIGPSLIAVHNHSDAEIELIPENDPFVTIAFQYVHTESSRDQHGNPAGRREILGRVGIHLSSEEEATLEQPFMSNRSLLMSKLQECEDYKEIQKNRKATIANQKAKSSLQKLSITIGIITVIIIILIIINVLLSTNQTKWGQKSWYPQANFFVDKGTEAFAIVWITMITNRLLSQQKEI